MTNQLPPLPEPVAWNCDWRADNDSPGWAEWYNADDPMPAQWVGTPPDEVTPVFTAGQMHAYAAAALAQQPAQPVAWLCELAQEDGSFRTQIVTEDPDGLRWNDVGEPSPYRVTPLYAAPQQAAPAPVARQPLTEAEMLRLFYGPGVMSADRFKLSTSIFIRIVRLSEAAHGIKAAHTGEGAA